MANLKDRLKIQTKFQKILKSKEKDLKLNYKKAYKDLEEIVKKIYEEFEVDGQIDLDSYLRYRQTRQLDATTAHLMTSLYIANEEVIDKLLREILENTRKSAIRTMADGKRVINPINKTFDTEKIINKSVAGKVRTERAKQAKSNLQYDVIGTINEGLENGQTYTQTAKELKKRFGKDINKSVATARTESHRVVETTKYDTMEEIAKQVKMTKTWHSVKDERVRSSHAAMDGVTIPFEDDFTLPSGVTCPRPGETGEAAEDINCRCYLSFDVVKEEEN